MALTEQELLPCPFCGTPNPVTGFNDYIGDKPEKNFWINCTHCLAGMDGWESDGVSTWDQMITQWNTRD